MSGSTSSVMIKRLLKLAAWLQLILTVIIIIWTGRLIYSIIYFFGGILSIVSFLSMIKMIDIVLNQKKKARALFFAVVFLKFVIIGAVFYLVSRVSETAVLFYILGLSLIILAIFMEGIYQLYRSAANGRA